MLAIAIQSFLPNRLFGLHVVQTSGASCASGGRDL